MKCGAALISRGSSEKSDVKGEGEKRGEMACEKNDPRLIVT